MAVILLLKEVVVNSQVQRARQSYHDGVVLIGLNFLPSVIPRMIHTVLRLFSHLILTLYYLSASSSFTSVPTNGVCLFLRNADAPEDIETGDRKRCISPANQPSTITRECTPSSIHHPHTDDVQDYTRHKINVDM